MKQLEKEALDDVAVDIELADDEKPILYVVRFRTSTRIVVHSTVRFWKQVPRRRSICPSAIGKGPRETHRRSRESPGRALRAATRSR